MNHFMLWYDNGNRSLGEKVREAVAWYTRKYGVPDCCEVNPRDMPKNLPVCNGIEIRTSLVVLPHTLHIGRLDLG